MENGYAVLPGLFSNAVCDELADWYEQHQPENPTGFHTSIHSSNVILRRAVTEKVRTHFDSSLERILNRYRPVFSAFTVKEPFSDSAFDLHLDWSMVDETRYTSLTVWVPLVDITEDNGFLWVLRESHRFRYTIRGGPGLNCWCETMPTAWTERYELKKLKLKKGDALIYDHRLFHGSPPNITGIRRLAINHTLIPEEANSLHYQFQGLHAVEVLEVPDDFYHTHLLNTPPTGVKVIETRSIKGCFIFQHGVNSLVAQSHFDQGVNEY